MTKILVVDDSPDWQKTLRGLLVDAGYQVSTAGNEEQAQSLAKQIPFDLALIDFRLHGDAEYDESGLVLAHNLKKLVPHMKVVLLTGYPARIDQVAKSFKFFQVEDFIDKSRIYGSEERDLAAIVKKILGMPSFDPVLDWLKNEATTYGLAKTFFKTADFDVELGLGNLFWVKNNSLEWQNAGRMPVYCFEEGQPITTSEMAQLTNNIMGEGKRNTYAFIIFREHMAKGTIRQLWETKQKGGPIIIPIHVAEVRQTLLEANREPNQPAYWKLVDLKHRWRTLADPYASVNSLTDPQWFFGKQPQSVVEEILSDITSGIDCFLIHGMRRVGKTTLLNQLILACQEERYATAKILCRPLSDQYSYADVLSEIIREWGTAIAAMYPDFGMPSPNLMVQQYSPKTASRFKADVFELAEAVQQYTGYSVRFILILDEVEQIFPNPESPEEVYYQYCSLTQILKSVIEAPEKTGIVSIVAAMEYPWIQQVDRFPHNDRFQNPLFWRFRLKPVKFLQKDDWDNMVQTMGELVGLEYEPNSLDELYRYSSGHPEITRKLCSCLVELRDSEKISSPVAVGDIYLALSYFLDHPLNYAYYLETNFWKDPLSTDLDSEQRLMQELAKEDKLLEDVLFSELLGRYKEFIRSRTESPTSDDEVSAEKRRLTDALRRLVELQIVTKDEQQGTCAISIPIFRDWIRQEILAIEVKYP